MDLKTAPNCSIISLPCLSSASNSTPPSHHPAERDKILVVVGLPPKNNSHLDPIPFPHHAMYPFDAIVRPGDHKVADLSKKHVGAAWRMPHISFFSA